MTTLVFGHKSPDTDSTGSAIIWSWFLAHHEPGAAEARVLGTPNTEAQFVLKRWGFDTPALLTDLPEGTPVVIVDTNNPAELPDNINKADIQAIIDQPVEVLPASLTAYPNPSAGPVNFEFVVDADARVIMDLYTTAGARVATIFNADVPAGMKQKVEFSDNLAEGMYVYILRWNEKKMTGKLIIKR